MKNLSVSASDDSVVSSRRQGHGLEIIGMVECVSVLFATVDVEGIEHVVYAHSGDSKALFGAIQQTFFL